MEGLGDKIKKASGNRTAYFMFGRFQPPHIGHINIINEMYKIAEENKADSYVFVSSTNKENNPLTVYQKITWLTKQMPNSNVRFINTTECLKENNSVVKACKTIFNVMDALKSQGYTNIILCVGSDRVTNFSKLTKYMTILGLGKERNKNSKNALQSISGTKMRNLSMKNDTEAIESFIKGVSLSRNDALRLKNQLKEGMKKFGKNSKKRASPPKSPTRKSPTRKSRKSHS